MSSFINELFKPELAFLRNAILLGLLAGPVLGVIGSMVVTRRISSRGDRVYSKMLAFPVDYEEIVFNANLIRGDSGLMLVREPFLLDDELREKCLRWVAWANSVDESKYSFFAEPPKED